MSADVAGDVPPSTMSARVAEMTALVGAAAAASTNTATTTTQNYTGLQFDNDNSDSELSDLDEDGARIPKEVLPKPTMKNVDAEVLPSTEVGDEAGAKGTDGDKATEEKVEPHHWDDGVPVFKPEMDVFQDFEAYVRIAFPFLCRNDDAT